MTNPMIGVLENMLTVADGTLKCQILFQGGMAAAGEVKNGPVPGTFQIRSEVGDPRTGRKIGEVDMVFLADSIIGVQTPVEAKLVEVGKPGLQIPRLT